MGESPDKYKYTSVRDAIEEFRQAQLHAIQNRPAKVKLPPVWAKEHAREEQRRAKFMASCALSPSPISPHKRAGAFPSHDAAMQQMQHQMSQVSNTSSVPPLHMRAQNPGAVHGLQSLSSTKLNSMSTGVFGAAPLVPGLTDNAYSGVGLYSMFGSQALSARQSSASFGFGTTTREQQQLIYLGPAHMKQCMGRAGAPLGSYEVPSSLGPQVLDTKFSYPARTWGLEDRFAADARDFGARVTPGPGAYRV